MVVIKKPKRSKLVKLSFKNNQAIKADVAGIKKILKQFYLLSYS